MGDDSLKYRALLVTGLTVWIGLCGTVPSQAAPAGRKPSIAESISSTLKKGTDKLTKLFTPKKPPGKPAGDAVSLASPGRPGAKLYVSVARMYEQSGKPDEAAGQYHKALKRTPNHLGALLGYARLEERRGRPERAARLYEQAAKAHPNEASVFNNQGSFDGRRGMFNKAVAAFERAIRLQPKNPKYRNNFAIVLVEMGRTGEAYGHLSAVHGEAAAYYNLGYVLYKKGRLQIARQHFAVAMEKDPSLAAARQMLEHLADVPMQARPAGGRPEAEIRVSRRPARPTQHTRPDNPPSGAGRPVVQKLPPVTKTHRPPPPKRPAIGPPIAPLPSGNYYRPPLPNAPLPPGN